MLRHLLMAWAPYTGIVLVGTLLAWLSSSHPGHMPVWAPWEFAPFEYLALTLPTLWFFQGLARTPAGARPAAWRQTLFLIGIGTIYLVLQTRFDYWAQHLFVLNRVQHVVMHHFGPFLVVAAGVGPTIRRGLPSRVRWIIDSRAVAALMRVLQQPVLAGVLFVGSFFFWLIPPVHFLAMIDIRLYQLMNWTMVVDGLLFWALAADFRPQPLAHVSYQARIGLLVGTMIPQVILGALLAVWPNDLYSFYDLCGRLVPAMSAVADQHYGGVVIWIPPGFLGMAGVLRLTIAMQKRKVAPASAASSELGEDIGAHSTHRNEVEEASGELFQSPSDDGLRPRSSRELSACPGRGRS